MKKSAHYMKWIASWIMVLALAAMGGLFVQVLMPVAPAQAQLPPRPSPLPPPGTSDAAFGGSIVLHVSPATSGVWSEVEWQDAQGVWHKVDGWQGTLGDGASQTWWVGAENFGKGPFRWRVYASPGGALLATSESFMLPSKPKASVNVDVKLP